MSGTNCSSARPDRRVRHYVDKQRWCESFLSCLHRVSRPCFACWVFTMSHFHPFWQPFLFRVHSLQHVPDQHDFDRFSREDHYWQLPEEAQGFRKDRSWEWCVWDPREQQSQASHMFRCLHIATSEETENLQIHDTRSLFWDPERGTYQQVPVDCSTTNVRDSGRLWRRLTFGRNPGPGNHDVAIVGYEMETITLHVAGPQRWFEQLLPRVCQTSKQGDLPCSLVGKLSLVVGLLALSTDINCAVFAVDQSFRPDLSSTLFVPHELPEPKSKSLIRLQETAQVNGRRW